MVYTIKAMFFIAGIFWTIGCVLSAVYVLWKL